MQQASLDLLLEVSETAQKKAAQELARATDALSQAQGRFDLLTKYLSEYQARFADALSAGTDALALANYRAFLAQLQRAIDQQVRVVAQLNAARGTSERDWQCKQFRVKSFELLKRRAQTKEARKVQRIEQQQTDERAAQAWQRLRDA